MPLPTNQTLDLGLGPSCRRIRTVKSQSDGGRGVGSYSVCTQFQEVLGGYKGERSVAPAGEDSGQAHIPGGPENYKMRKHLLISGSGGTETGIVQAILDVYVNGQPSIQHSTSS